MRYLAIVITMGIKVSGWILSPEELLGFPSKHGNDV
jgi:hypothetical protein